jgi:two-component system, OmpR family, KDP operon response regulator KdpE
MNNLTILIIDDEAAIRKLLEITLTSNQYRVHCAENSKSGIHLAASFQPDLILLDLGLPDESGHNTLRKLREWYSHPIIVVSVQNSEEDIVRALDNGANDFLTKPFRTGELLARIRSSIRTNMLPESKKLIQFGNLTLDFTSRLVKKEDNIVKLTNKEYNLLALLAKNEGKVLTHQFLLKEVWGIGYIDQSQYLRVFIAQIRKKIESDPNNPVYILTESGIGYRFWLP